MKLILSRKGFDSAAGGCPSALIDGRPVSFPIPTRQPSPTHYGDLAGDIATMVTDLSHGRITADHRCHLDPDLDPNALPRLTRLARRTGPGQHRTDPPRQQPDRTRRSLPLLGIVPSCEPQRRRRALAIHRSRRTPHLRLAADRRDPDRRRGSATRVVTTPVARLASAPRHRLEQEQHRLRRAQRTRAPRRTRRPSRLRTVPHRRSPDGGHESPTVDLDHTRLAQPAVRWHRADLPSP